MEWIKLEDQLPPFFENDYLVTDGESADVYRWMYKSNKKWTFSDRDVFLDIEITHWMPLPKLPKK